MTTITVNGAMTDIADGATVSDLLGRLDVPAEARGVAVAVDAEVVPRGEWTSIELHEGSRVEVVQAVQGG